MNPDKRLMNFKRQFSSKLPKESFDDSKYICVRSHLMLNDQVLRVGITQEKYSTILNSAKQILSKESPRYQELPEEYINKKILEFGFNTFFADEKITDFTPLTSCFTDNNWNKYDIILYILNSELDEDFFEHERFSLYNPKYFYENILPSELESVKNSNMKETIETSYNGIHPATPYVICVLKNVFLYETDTKIKKQMIQDYMEYFFTNTSLILRKHPKFSEMKECFQYSRNLLSLVSKDKQTYSVSGSTRGFFANGFSCPYNSHKKILIPLKEIKKYSYFYDYFQSTDNLNKRIQRCINWLAQSTLTENTANSFVLISIAAESLLTNTREQITNNLSSRLSTLLAKDEQAQTKIKNKIKNLYDQRSKIVHNGIIEITSDSKEVFFDYVFKGILKVIDLIKQNKIHNTEELYSYLETTPHSTTHQTHPQQNEQV